MPACAEQNVIRTCASVTPSLAHARPPDRCAITFLLVSLPLTFFHPSPVACCSSQTHFNLTSSRPAAPIDPSGSFTQRETEVFSGKDPSLKLVSLETDTVFVSSRSVVYLFPVLELRQGVRLGEHWPLSCFNPSCHTDKSPFTSTTRSWEP